MIISTTKINPYTPIPFRPGNTITRRYVVKFMDRVGNSAVITKVDYKTKKGKVVEGHTLYVRWK